MVTSQVAHGLTRGRRASLRTVALGGIAIAAGCTAMIDEASRGPAPIGPVGQVALVPFVSLSQGMLTARRDATGMPLPTVGMTPLRLLRPVALTARGNDVYVVDAGHAALFRVDPASSLYTRIDGVIGSENVRVEIGPDGVLLVADRARREVLRLMSSGPRLAPLGAAATEIGQPVDLALDELRGRILVADGVYRQVLAFSPSGQAFSILPLNGDARLNVRALSYVAAGPRQLYLADPQCGCVLVAAVDGPLTGRLAGPPTGAISGMAVDSAGRLYVADGEAREIRVYVDARPTQTFSYRAMGVAAVSDVHYADGVLWLVDPVGARVEGRRVVTRLSSDSSARWNSR